VRWVPFASLLLVLLTAQAAWAVEGDPAGEPQGAQGDGLTKGEPGEAGPSSTALPRDEDPLGMTPTHDPAKTPERPTQSVELGWLSVLLIVLGAVLLGLGAGLGGGWLVSQAYARQTRDHLDSVRSKLGANRDERRRHEQVLERDLAAIRASLNQSAFDADAGRYAIKEQIALLKSLHHLRSIDRNRDPMQGDPGGQGRHVPKAPEPVAPRLRVLREPDVLELIEGLEAPATFYEDVRRALSLHGWAGEVRVPIKGSDRRDSLIEVESGGTCWLVPLPSQTYGQLLTWYSLPPGASRDQWVRGIERLATLGPGDVVYPGSLR
jgi:hypothetical protein